MLALDGSAGEGGGQVLRTSLSLAALTGRPFHLKNVRGQRPKPGLRPQHLTAVHAVAAVCGAQLSGAEIDSQELIFRPTHAPRGGVYYFDVEEYAPHGSAGSVTLILQALLWPLLFADAPARVVLRGGTHVPFSPPFHYIQQVALPAFARFGVQARCELLEWGWMPHGQGQVVLELTPREELQAYSFDPPEAEGVDGLAIVTNLPGHIPHRMARRADNLIEATGRTSRIDARRLRSQNPGAGLFLWLSGGQAGASALGRKGLPAQTVAENAVAELMGFVESGAAVDAHLADQLLLPMGLANGRSHFTTSELTQHTLTNAALIARWLPVDVTIKGELGTPGQVTVSPQAA